MRLLRSIWAVVAGSVVDMFLTIAITGLLLIWGAAEGVGDQLPPEQATEALFAATMSNPLVFGLGLVLSCLASVVGGYVAAAVAQRRPLLHGALTAWLCVLAVGAELVTGSSGWPWWLLVPFAPLAPALAALGGAAWQRRADTAALLPATAPPIRASLFRRSAVATVYAISLTLVISVTLVVSLSQGCVQDQLCEPGERALSLALAWAGLVLIPCVFVGGYFGLLPGARNRVAVPLPAERLT